jgi:hypothetical protein
VVFGSYQEMSSEWILDLLGKGQWRRLRTRRISTAKQSCPQLLEDDVESALGDMGFGVDVGLEVAEKGGNDFGSAGLVAAVSVPKDIEEEHGHPAFSS